MIAYQSILIHFGFDATPPNDHAACGKRFFDSSDAISFKRFLKDGADGSAKYIDMQLPWSLQPLVISTAGNANQRTGTPDAYFATMFLY